MKLPSSPKRGSAVLTANDTALVDSVTVDYSESLTAMQQLGQMIQALLPLERSSCLELAPKEDLHEFSNSFQEAGIPLNEKIKAISSALSV